MQTVIELAEKGMVPDPLIRMGIRRLLKQRLNEAPESEVHERNLRFIEELRKSPIACNTQEANQQHYELPAEFFELVLGPHLKYSSAFYEGKHASLDDAEQAMLKLTMERAQLQDGQKILELGCGWGSLTLAMAQAYPHSEVVAVSNSGSQKTFIEKVCHERDINNVTVITCDMNHFDTEERFDRVVSIEMFEHMRNYESLMARISRWLTDDGKLFVHIFCHRDQAYPFETEGDDNWMGKYFFTGGIMPSDHLLLYFQDRLVVETHWRVAGSHYARTSEHWLRNMDTHKHQIYNIFEKVYGPAEAEQWVGRWRIFFMSCAELFGYSDGNEWWVSHYLFRKRVV